MRKFSRSLFISTALIVASVSTIDAEIPYGYYDSLEGLSGVALKKAVKEVARKHYNRISYGTSTWKVFVDSDVRTIDGVRYWWDMYSNVKVEAEDYSTHKGMNIEHSVAKSWWGSSNADQYDSYYDVMHLNPSNETANQQKSNYPLGKVKLIRWTDDDRITMVGTPESGYGGGSTYVYEPCDEYKGDFARTFFYIFTAYDDNPWQSNTNWMYDTSSDLTLKPWAYNMLLEWAANDPVSQKEIDRNEAVKRHQGNRNPFIDCPDLPEYIWGSLKNQPYHFSNQGNYDREKTKEIYEDFTVSNAGLPMGSSKKPETPKDFCSVTTDVEYEIMGCYVNSYMAPYYLLINGKNNAGAYISFTLTMNCNTIKLHTTPACSTNQNSAVNVYADNNLLGKYAVNVQNATVEVEIPQEYQKAGTVYKVESATTAYNQQFAGFTYMCYNDIVEATDIRLNKTNVAMKSGESVQLTATVEPAVTTDRLSWTTSNSSVATVSSTGVVTAVGVGRATITATCGKVSATCDVQVEEGSGSDQPVQPSEGSVTFDFTNISSLSPSYDPNGNVTEYDVTDVKFENGVVSILSKASSGASNKPRLFKSSSGDWSYRFYNKCQVEISIEEGYSISEIVFKATNLSKNGIEWSGGGAFSNNVWTANSEDVPSVTVSKTVAANNPVISTITVNYKAKSRVDDVAEDNVPAPVEYYNLQGIRVMNPSEGVYIRRQGSSVSKVIIR